MQRPQFVILTDRATMKAIWISPPEPAAHPPSSANPINQSLHVDVVETITFHEPHQHFTEKVSDMAGAYSSPENSATGGVGPHGSQPRRGASSISEIHWKMEADRRAITNLVSSITSVLSREKPESWSLAAPQDIHKQLVCQIPKVYLDRLIRVLPRNLTRADTKNILGHFVVTSPST